MLEERRVGLERYLQLLASLSPAPPALPRSPGVVRRGNTEALRRSASVRQTVPTGEKVDRYLS